MSFNYALANRWACCPSYSSSYTSLKHLEAQAAKVADSGTLTGDNQNS